MNSKPTIQIALTPEQKEQIERATGKRVAALQLKLDELEQRLAPGGAVN